DRPSSARAAEILRAAISAVEANGIPAATGSDAAALAGTLQRIAAACPGELAVSVRPAVPLSPADTPLHQPVPPPPQSRPTPTPPTRRPRTPTLHTLGPHTRERPPAPPAPTRHPPRPPPPTRRAWGRTPTPPTRARHPPHPPPPARRTPTSLTPATPT